MRRSLILAAVPLAVAAWAAPAAAADKERVYYTIRFEDGLSPPPAAAGSLAAPPSARPGYKFGLVFVPTGRWAPPQPSGIRRVTLVTSNAGGCTVGRRYPRATLEGGGERFAFTDVRITGCSPNPDGPGERITFFYGAVD